MLYGMKGLIFLKLYEGIEGAISSIKISVR